MHLEGYFCVLAVRGEAENRPKVRRGEERKGPSVVGCAVHPRRKNKDAPRMGHPALVDFLKIWMDECTG